MYHYSIIHIYGLKEIKMPLQAKLIKEVPGYGPSFEKIKL